MTLIEIRGRLCALAMNVEEYSNSLLSEELLVLSDCLDDIQNDVVGTISGIAKGLKEVK
jgi:hypothetical protein